MSCNRCAGQAEAALRTAGVPARQTQAGWANDAGRPGRCERCGAFLTSQGQCNRPGCGALHQSVLQQLESVGVPDQQARAIAASREKPGAKGAKLRQLIQERVERLAELTDEAAASAEMQQWFQFISQFHQYSFNNRCLIVLQRPGASQVAGYKTWQNLGRQVRRGEKGIAIIVPCTWRKEVENPKGGEVRQERGLYFRVGHVFDVSQTEGDELPEPPQWINQGDQGAELAERLASYAQSLDVEVSEAQLPGQRQGESHGGKVVLRQDATPLGRAATLAHEIAHELMHGPEQRVPARRQLNEWEAEACAYVVCQHFGYETQAPNYLALWRGNREALLGCMERISSLSPVKGRASQQIISALEAREA